MRWSEGTADTEEMIGEENELADGIRIEYVLEKTEILKNVLTERKVDGQYQK